MPPWFQPGGKLFFSHPIYSFFAFLLCLFVSGWSLHPLRIAIIFSLLSHRRRYSFQLFSPFWTVFQHLPLLLPWPLAHWVLSECSIHQLVLITAVTGLFVSFAASLRVRTWRDLVPAFRITKQTIIRFLVDRSLYESYFIAYLCLTDRPLATQLNMVLIHSVTIHDLLVSIIVDPTGLGRARAYY